MASFHPVIHQPCCLFLKEEDQSNVHSSELEFKFKTYLILTLTSDTAVPSTEVHLSLGSPKDREVALLKGAALHMEIRTFVKNKGKGGD